MKHLAWLLSASCLFFVSPVLSKNLIARTPVPRDESQFNKVSPDLNSTVKLSNAQLKVDPTFNRQKAQYISVRLANDIAYGLVIAHQNQQIRYGTRMYRQVQTAINLLRRGAGLEGASRRSGVPRSVLDQLMEWGQQRPGALIHDVE